MAKIVHTDAEVISTSFSENDGNSVDAVMFEKNINELFEREDIKQFNALLLGNRDGYANITKRPEMERLAELLLEPPHGRL